jgi:tRNA pseudouridine38-40 synthase
MLYVKTAYIGNAFHGSQTQPDYRTVEGELTEKAIKVGLIGINDRIRLYSRTDKWVSAIGNIFRVKTSIDPAIFVNRLNRVLKDVYCTGFCVDTNPKEVIKKRYSYFLPAEYNKEELLKIAKLFTGTHHFDSFTKGFDKFYANIDSIIILENGNHIKISFTGKKFKWGMIRKIVWTMLALYDSRLDVQSVKKALDGDIKLHVGLADPASLYLEDIDIGIPFIPIVPDVESINKYIYRHSVQILFLNELIDECYMRSNQSLRGNPIRYTNSKTNDIPAKKSSI